MRSFDLMIGESQAEDVTKTTIRSPYDGAEIGEVAFAGPRELENAVRIACDAFYIISREPVHERAKILRAISQGISDRVEELAAIIRDEAGKPIRFAKGEVQRAVNTFSVAADEALRMEGDLIPLDTVQGGEGRIGLTRRFPIGPILAISPFNFPLNLVAHKVAPAIAAGNSVVLKPASQTPMSALILGEIALDAGLPRGVFNVVPCKRDTADRMIEDTRFKKLTFTGSAQVGWDLRARAGKKKVTLELGGNAAAIVEPDADVDFAAKRLALGAFAYAGQVCISVQRIYVHQSVAAEFTDRLVASAREEALWGDPADPKVVCGPLIDTENVDRILEWIDEARAHGASVLCGGDHHGNIVTPAVLVDVDPTLRIAAEEAFGPVVVLDSYSTLDEAIAKVNDSKYGLQAGIFTSNTDSVFKAFNEIEVGGLIHNDYPTFRVDPMPYGGVKDSGFGREGLRYAIEEMTEPRLLVIKEGTKK
jgi:glyceraldehyde-3-phosphate dehydrogenase (NADP+)